LSSLTIRLSGKNEILKEVHPTLAAFKEISMNIKKAKVPITSLSGEYKMCVYPHDGLSAGDTKSWTKVSSDLKQLGLLQKNPKGWELKIDGKVMEAPTLVTYQDTYEAEPSFAVKLQKMIINSSKGKMFFVEEQLK